MDLMQILFDHLPTVVLLLIVFLVPINREKENKRRAAKGKSAFTEEAFQKYVIKHRIIAVIIFAVAFVIVQLMNAFA